MKYQNLIWDFDGTLFDSYPHSEAIFRQYLAEIRGIMPPISEIDALFKQTLTVAYLHYGLTEEEIREFQRREADVSAEPKVRPFPEAREILEDTVAQGGRNYLYTHRDRLSLYYLENEGLLSLFSGVVTEEMGFPRKPEPHGVRYLVETYGLDKEKTVMIGDREIDVLSGQNAGVAGCLVTSMAEVRRKSGAEWIAEDLAAVGRLLEIWP